MCPSHTRTIVLLLAAGAACSEPGLGQDKPEAPKVQGAAASVPPGKPLEVSLAQAIALARQNSTAYQAALTEAGTARESSTQARDALLPQVAYDNQYLYTQANELGAVRFIAANAVHEYVSQGSVHESIDLAAILNYRQAAAGAAVARAKAEVAARGLVATVVGDYFAVLAADSKLAAASRAAEEGDRFLALTGRLEHGGEVAHSDTLKAQLQSHERQRQLKEAALALLNARLDLAVLIFPDFRDNFVLTENLHARVPLPTREEVEQQAARDNPDLAAAFAAVRMTANEVNAARAEYLPSLGIDYFYGIDSAQFATSSVVNGQKITNLGSSALASLSLPVWNWGATRSRVRAAEFGRKQAQRELSFAQRNLAAGVRLRYAEAETALDELAGLERSAELAAESQRLTTLRYQAGEGTVLEVVDSQNVLVEAVNRFADGAVRYRLALANLQTLTGVLTAP
jgi:outer membrane protein TolC